MALERILVEKRKEVARQKIARPLSGFIGELAPARRSLLATLRKPGPRYILECKKASPSRGLIRPDYDPVAIASAYAAVAAGISVLTDGPFFQGSLEDLASVSQATDLPILRKDFVVDPYQVYEARRFGADAVLLMLSVLQTDALFAQCLEAAQRLGMDALVEVHDQAELSRALKLGVSLIGINNRNLATLELSLEVSERLAPQVPGDRVVIAESGIGDHRDIRRLRSRVDGFLVGSVLMARPDVGCAARELVFGRVKVCGLTRPEDAQVAWNSGASLGGMIFAPQSRRRIDLARARQVRAASPLRLVGVFVDATPDEILEAVFELALVAVQLHGDESPDFVRTLRASLPPGCEIWKAVRVLDRIPTPEETAADRLLLDAYHPDARGGTGTKFDWGLLAAYPRKDQAILAGGLDPESAAAADAQAMYALDVNSGVETAPGEKSERLLEAFFSALRGEDRTKES